MKHWLGRNRDAALICIGTFGGSALDAMQEGDIGAAVTCGVLWAFAVTWALYVDLQRKLREP